MMSRAQNITTKKSRIKQIQFLIENLTEPVFVDFSKSNNSLSIEFGMEDTNTFNPAAITYRVLNLKTKSADEITYNTLSRFMFSIQSYLPRKLQFKSKLWHFTSFANNNLHNVTPEMFQALDDLKDWLVCFLEKIEDRLANQLYLAGNAKSQYLDILKRRFKENWCDKVETKVDAKVEAEVDKTINIIVEDY